MAWLCGAALLDLAGAAALGARLLPPPRPFRDRLVAAALLALLLPVLEVRALGALGALTGPTMAAATAGVGLAALALVGRRARACAIRDVNAARAALASALAGGAASAGAWVGLAAITLAGAAAYLLPPWAWDALGYHLPIVHDALRTQALREVPTSVPYVNAYPRAADLFFVACRLLLGSDTLLDFCQAPFALAACAGVAALARRAGTSAARAGAYGALFLAVPVVMLQMATNYVDVAVAALLVVSVYFATGPRTRADLLLFGLAAGFLLGSKPSTPPAVAILFVVVLARGLLARDLGPALAACALAVALGGERYAANLVEHHNPVWPVALEIGPLSLPGLTPAARLFLLGLPEPYAHYAWPRRLIASLIAMPDRYIYDMRLGGLGPLFALGLLPITVLSARRSGRRALPLLLLAAVAVASPAAHWMRYTIALPAALLAHAAAATERLRRGARIALDLGLAALAAAGVAQAAPGLTDGGPSLAALLRMSPEQRATAVGLDGREALWVRARSLVRSGEAFAYDASFSLPGQLWTGDPQVRLIFLGDAGAADDVAASLDRERVRVLVAGDEGPAALAVLRDPEHHRALFRCPVDRCTVYERLGDARGDALSYARRRP